MIVGEWRLGDVSNWKGNPASHLFSGSNYDAHWFLAVPVGALDSPCDISGLNATGKTKGPVLHPVVGSHSYKIGFTTPYTSFLLVELVRCDYGVKMVGSHLIIM